ncbi:hypothetical protein B0T16DRAFT_455963 [Cercophora newfieldiana]|uniref:F-box domain-containing protein n=1 Tax=Cercophora newfieldiana TaxID=92897 RepID=A0AA40CT83_9PEZI|nr:hypothetical protein B0T16DRAFT_455963 [Cercophora newfieldiana]
MGETIRGKTCRIAHEAPALASSPLLKLPNELITRIVDLATEPAEPLWRWWWDRRNQHFRAVATPRLYSQLVRLGTRTHPEVSLTRLSQLLRSLRSNPALADHCRTLEIHLGHLGHICKAQEGVLGTRSKTQLVGELSSLLHRTRILVARNSLHRWDETWDGHREGPGGREIIFAAVGKMPELQELYLWNCCHVTSREIRDALSGSSCLRSLLISRCIIKSAVLPDLRKSGTGFPCLTSLSVFGFPAWPTDLQYFFHGPPKLEHLIFALDYTDGEQYVDEGGGPWSLPRVFSFLAPQRETLRTIKIGTFYNTECDLQGLDLSEYTNLVDLELSARNTGITTGQEEILSAPRLENFTWNFQTNDQQNGPLLEEFDEVCETWVRKFMQHAVATNSSLKKIHIIFTPDIWDGPPPVWPWDRMDTLNCEGQDMGIAVTYTTPSVEKEYFDHEYGYTSALPRFDETTDFGQQVGEHPITTGE